MKSPIIPSAAPSAAPPAAPPAALLAALFAALCLAALPAASAPTATAPAASTPAANFSAQNLTIGVFIPEGADMDCGVPMPGYPPELATFYETLPDRNAADALGIGAFGIVPNHDWRWKFRRKPVMPRRNMPELRRPMRAGLPLVADVSIAKGSHTWMPYMEGVNPKENAWIEGQVFGFPFSFADSEGLGLWRAIWNNSAQWFASEGAEPDAWFLFRDADWWDESTYARREFAQFLSGKYKTPAELSAALKSGSASAASLSRAKNFADQPRIQAEFAKFHEEKFNAALQAAALVLPHPEGGTARVFFQPKSLRAKGVDIRAAAQRQAVICATSDEAGRVYAALCLAAAAEGKPLAHFGMPAPDTAAKLRDMLLTQFARGYTQIWLSDWRSDAKARLRYAKNDAGKTVRDEAATEAASRALAAARPASILNPYAVPPGVLDGINAARQALAGAAPLFTPENRLRGAQVALLHSRSADRIAGTKTALAPAITSDAAAEALLNLHIKTTVVFEENLSRLTNNSPLRAVIATDSSFTASEKTLSILSAFAASGGLLILTENALTKNEFGDAPSGASFATNAVILAAADFNSKLAPSLASAGIEPFCQSLDPATDEPLDGIEIWHAQDATGETALLAFNRRGAEIQAKIAGEVRILPPDECVVIK